MKVIPLLLIVILGHFNSSGQIIGDFTLPDVTSDSDFLLSRLIKEKAIVIIFFSNKCAYSRYYLERISYLNKEFSPKGVKFILVNSNNSSFVPEESVAEMKIYADKNLPEIPYLADKDKKVKNLLKATRTPEAYILIPENDEFKVVYNGAIDDNAQSSSDVGHSYLSESLILLLKNNKISLNRTRAVGCLIK